MLWNHAQRQTGGSALYGATNSFPQPDAQPARRAWSLSYRNQPNPKPPKKDPSYGTDSRYIGDRPAP